MVALQGCVIKHGKEILVQNDWDYWKDFMEGDMGRAEMRVNCDNLKIPAKRQLDKQMVMVATVHAENKLTGRRYSWSSRTRPGKRAR